MVEHLCMALGRISFDLNNDVLCDDRSKPPNLVDKVKNLKRKLNIVELNDLNQFKLKMVGNDEGLDNGHHRSPILLSDYINCGHANCNECSTYGRSASNFKSTLERSYGNILPLQVRVGICELFVNHCMQLSCNQQKICEKLIFDILKLLDNVLHSSIKGVGGHFDKANNHDDHEGTIFYATNMPQGSSIGINKMTNNGDGKCLMDKKNMDHLNCKMKVSLLDVRDSFCYKGAAKLRPSQLAEAFLGVRNVDYVPDTFSPTPPLKSMLPPCFKHNIGPTKSSTTISDCGTAKTPQSFIVKNSSATTNVSHEIKIMGERKFNEKFRSMCKKSDKMYDNLMSLKHSYRRDSRGINEAQVVNDNVGANCSIINERYCPIQKSTPPAVSIEQFNNSSKFCVIRQEIMYYMAVCRLSSSKTHHDFYCVDIGGCHVKFSSLGHSMVAVGKVGSFVMNVLCRKFF
ncbi:uncharacterized protein LOC133904602 [Phragmites australis]|uniref:uncharacterized protein LOC133904602 n=1 Tax=Phragmites australis TaxID=29695 RepID=UPI002D7761D3|nr:uncharacterized protein LOC133904602 [Phragmites australis]